MLMLYALIAALEDCRMVVHGFVWWSVCNGEGMLDQWCQRESFQTTVCGLRF